MSTNRTTYLLHGEGSIINQENVAGGSLFEGVVDVSGREKQLTLKHDGLVLASRVNGASSDKNKDLCLTWQDVIRAIKEVKPTSDKHPAAFIVHYIYNCGNNQLDVKNVQITLKDGNIDQWVSAINEKCQKVPGRPKKVFVIINPVGGSKTASKIYQKKVAPLFELAGIHTEVKFTERSKHAAELGENHDFSDYDAIVVVGGDGLYHEVLLGYTLRIQKEAGVEYNNPEVLFAKPQIPFGIIPAGTGNGISGWCNGTVDEVTATLNIIRGENYRAEVLTVHSCGQFVSICGVLFGYGEFSDLIKRTDELRWMGRVRYPYTMLGMLFKKPRMFNCTIEYRLVDDNQNQDLNRSPGAESAHTSEWLTYTDNTRQVCGIFCHTCEHIIDKSDLILNPYGNCMDLLVDFGSGRIDLLKTLVKFITGKNGAEPLPAQLELVSKITGFRFRLCSDMTDNEHLSAAKVKERELECLLNIDGEVVKVNSPEIEVRVHPDFISLYGCHRVPGNAEGKQDQLIPPK